MYIQFTHESTEFTVLGFALRIRPSKDIFWTHRPENCRGYDPDKKACGRWNAKTNPGMNCELNSLIATVCMSFVITSSPSLWK